jgi:hypothetical protein
MQTEDRGGVIIVYQGRVLYGALDCHAGNCVFAVTAR